jgi:hypothetical protein
MDFSRWLINEEEREERDFFSRFATGGQDFLSAGGVQPLERVEPTQRNLLDRIFAPFEAPQQFLFGLTNEIGEEGFQIGDVGRAFKHGLHFANPFANVERISPEEVRQTFFGDDEEEGAGRVFKGATNLAISLLYDPLLVAPIAKGLGLVGKTGQAARNLERITNPAGAALVESIGLAKRTVVPAAGKAAEAVLGAERAENWGAVMSQWLVNRYAGLPDEMRKAVDLLDQGTMRWRTQAHKVLKNAEKLGGTPAQVLMAEALEDEAIWLARAGKDSADALAQVSKFDKRLEEMGVSKDLFWDIYDQSRRLDDSIGTGLVNAGVIGGDEFSELRGKHLRRMFLATERPAEYIDRLEALNVPPSERFSIKQFQRGLNSIRSELDATILSAPKGQGQLFDLGETLFGGNRYFRDGERTRFNVKAFTEDLNEWMTKNSSKSADDIFAHVQDEMLSGVAMPAEFWKNIGNHISGAFVHVEGSQEWADKLRQWHYTPGFNWHSVNERLEVVAKRQDIPEEIRKALGEVLEFGPRIASEASDAGRLLETRKFLDNVAGIVRDPDDPTKILSRGGNKIAFTAEQAAGQKGLVRLQGKHLGELDGMFVKPAVAQFLNHMEGVGNIANPSAKAWNAVGDFIRRAVGQFKIHKVILDPAAQVRNFIGNAVLMDMAGVSPFNIGRINKAVMELRDFGKTGNLGKYLQLAEDAGVTMFQHTFAREELQIIARHLGDDLAGDSHKTMNALQRVVGGFQETYGRSVEYMGNLFEFEEKMFKLATFIGKYDEIIAPMLRRGKSITPDVQKHAAMQAGELAERALFNYADIPHLAKFARDYGVVPFITFPMKATSFVAKTLVEHPHRVLKYNRTVEGLNEMAGSSEDTAREIAALPEHVRENLVIKMPFKDDSSRAQYLDLSYFMPWYVIQDLAQSMVPSGEGNPLPRDGMFTPPAMAVIDAFRRNEDSLGRPIITPDMSSTEKWGRMGEFLWQLWAPPDAPGGSRASSIGRAMQAVARNEAEPIRWLDALGAGFSLGGSGDRALGRSGFMPTSQAQAQTGGATGAVLGGLAGLFAASTVASDAPQQAVNAMGKASNTATEIQRQMAQVRANRNLSPREKAIRIRRLLDQLQESREEQGRTVTAMF